MGMYSYLNYENLHTDNPDGLREWIKYNNKKFGSESYWYAVKVFEGGSVSLEELDGWKIISYWYPEFLKFLRELALFIEGTISFDFETHDERAVITFENGEFSINFGTMQYEKANMEEVLNLHGEKPKGYYRISKKLKDIIMIGKI